MSADRINMLLQMMAEDPGDSFFPYALSLEHLKKGDTSEALKWMNKVLKADPGYLAVYYQLGKLHEQLGDFEKARDIYENGAELAKKQGDSKTLNEIHEALWMLD